jgi:hypothetical protein
MAKIETADLIGKTFGGVTIVADAGYGGRGWGPMVRTRCFCGTESVSQRRAVVSGKKKSCGCAQRAAFERNRAPKHGHTAGGGASPTWRSWNSMMTRCYNERHEHFAEYGGRGIKVCERWHEFANFLADMGERPKGKTLDRYPNGDGDYEPGNCRWATPKEQAANRRASPERASRRHFEYRGQVRPIGDLIKETGCPVPRQTVIDRVKRGWSIEDALTLPSDRARRVQAAAR